MDFKPIAKLNGQLHITTEVVYLNGFEKTEVRRQKYLKQKEISNEGNYKERKA